MDEGDDSLEEKVKGGGGGGGLEGNVENPEEGRDEDVRVVPLELIREPINTRNRASPNMSKGDIKILCRKEAVAVRALGEVGIARGKGAGDRVKEGVLVRVGGGARELFFFFFFLTRATLQVKKSLMTEYERTEERRKNCQESYP